MIELIKTQEKINNIVKVLLSDTTKIYVYGRNFFSKQLYENLNIEAFVDDYTQDKTWLGKPVIKSNKIDKDSIVISCSTAIYPISSLKNLQGLGLSYITYLDLFNKDILPLQAEFFTQAREDYVKKNWHYQSILSKLTDKKSITTFNNIISFRNTGSFETMKNYCVDINNQYFPEFLILDEEVFVDAGGFDGQTSLEFISRCSNYKTVYVFEPSQNNLEMAKENLQDYVNINYINKGLLDRATKLNFNNNEGSANSISDTGDVVIEVDALDNLVKEKITFFKIDIEGAESLAIEGAKQHILNDHPKIAIAVYHKPDDFWKIPEQILDIREDYDLYLRHYTEGTDETVMYFIPRQRKLNKVGMKYYWDDFLVQRDRSTSFLFNPLGLKKNDEAVLFQKYVCIVNIETSTYCNRLCSYCPVSLSDSRKTQSYMDDAVFEKVIHELKLISYASTICFNLYNEPLADNNIFPRIEAARKKLPAAFLLFNSNGDFLSTDKLDKLSEIGLNAIFVTLHPSSKKKYNPIDREKKFHKLFKKLGVTSYEIQEPLKNGNLEANIEWKGMKLRVMANDWSKFGNSRAGEVGFLDTKVVRTSPCVRPLREFTVCHDGNVFPCCQFFPDRDSNQKYAIGNVAFNSIFEIYSSEKLAMWRKHLFSYGEKKSPCSSCADADFSARNSENLRNSIIDGLSK